MDIFDQLEKSFNNHLRSLLDLVRGQNDKELDDLLVEQGRDEEEKRLIREVCEEIDLEYQLMEDLKRSEKEPGPWFEQQIEDTVLELFPDATQEEIEEVKNAAMSDLEDEIKDDALALEKEAEVVQSLELEDNEEVDDDNQLREEGQNDDDA